MTEGVSGLAVGAASAAADMGDKKLMFVGIHNMVICRDLARKDADGFSVELWRRDLGVSEEGHKEETYVVFCGGIVVARFQKTLTGLDPATGSVLWTQKLTDYGAYDLIVMVPGGSAVYIGCLNTVIAVATQNGAVIWSYQITKSGDKPVLPSIVFCETCLVAVCGMEVACLDLTNGSPKWKAQLKNGAETRAASCAWDFENRVFVGKEGYVYRYDLHTGAELKRINLSRTGNCDASLVFDKKRKVLYAMTVGRIFAFSKDEDNKLLWRNHVTAFDTKIMTLDQESGRIYFPEANQLVCVDTSGKVLFCEQFCDRRRSAWTVYSIIVDSVGDCRVFVCSEDRVIIFTGEGKVIEHKELKLAELKSKLMPFLCTTTASLDPNSSTEEYTRLMIGQSSS